MTKANIFGQIAKNIFMFQFFQIDSESFKTYFEAKIYISKIFLLQYFQGVSIFKKN